MAIEIAQNTPLAMALDTAIKPKLIEVGWATDGGGDDSTLSEYIILMLINGKTQDEIAAELAGDLLGLGSDDPGVKQFVNWLFEQIEALNAQINGQPVHATGFAVSAHDSGMAMDQDMETGTPSDSTELNAPTGPKSMRNGESRGGVRGKRMIGQMNRAMDRSHEAGLHRIRGASGTERINRMAPSGPRGRGGHNNRAMNNRANNIAHGMAAQMPGMPGGPGMNGMPDMAWMMQGQGGDLFSLLQQQNQMMAALSQQLAQSQSNSQNGQGRGRGKSLFERTQRGGHGFRRGGNHGQNQSSQPGDPANPAEGEANGEDVDMNQTAREPPNPETTVCMYNLKCTNKDCKFAHQSPAAPPGVTVDVSDICTYGVACKNFKCTARHPSPATKRAHQSEQECKFWPNCTNRSCPFKHPAPICRNGADCKVENCQFTHLQTMCKFKPCTNRFCQYKHEEGQRGTFQDKVWTADGASETRSDRKFVDQSEPEEFVGTEQPKEEVAMDEEIA